MEKFTDIIQKACFSFCYVLSSAVLSTYSLFSANFFALIVSSTFSKPRPKYQTRDPELLYKKPTAETSLNFAGKHKQ